MNKVIINGKFMSDRMQGIVRYARELTLALDKQLDEQLEVEIIIPPNSYDVPSYENIKVIKWGKNNGIRWEQIDFKKYVRSHKEAVCLNLCNVTPFGCKPGITAVHDIMYKVFPDNYKTLRNRLSRLWHIIQYNYIFKHECGIITVSEFSKNEIENNYPNAKGKIEVIPNGWQHILKYKDNPDWEKKYPYLKPRQFYFSLSTLAKNKNGEWILGAAKRNPTSVFAIAGKKYDISKKDIPSNVYMLGFISDEDACSLIKNCKAFIHPSLYEGFGIPPLEALALGAEVISSNVTSLPEVLGDSVHYIDPYNPDVELDSILKMPVADKNEVLKRYSWKVSAKKLIGYLKKICQ